MAHRRDAEFFLRSRPRCNFPGTCCKAKEILWHRSISAVFTERPANIHRAAKVGRTRQGCGALSKSTAEANRCRMEQQLRNLHFVARLVSLSDRQKQIVALLCEGLSNKMIARQLNVTEGTVKSQLHTIYEKLGVQTRYALMTALSNRGRV